MPDDAPQSSLILYQTEDGRTRIQCRFENETVWLTQALIAELFQKDVRTINEHLVNIFDEGELSREATIRKFRIVRREGAREVVRAIEHYSLPAILAVGYRVRSPRGTQFRQWATARLSEYLVKGFTMDDERLKNPPGPGHTDYFDELLERIRDIRASERRMYLREAEIAELNRIATMFLDFAEDQARRRKQIFLHTWKTRLDDFLRLNERAILRDGGKVTREEAEEPDAWLSPTRNASVRAAPSVPLQCRDAPWGVSPRGASLRGGEILHGPRGTRAVLRSRRRPTGRLYIGRRRHFQNGDRIAAGCLRMRIPVTAHSSALRNREESPEGGIFSAPGVSPGRRTAYDPTRQTLARGKGGSLLGLLARLARVGDGLLLRIAGEQRRKAEVGSLREGG